MDHHVDADADPQDPLAPNTLRFNVLIASCSIIGLVYLLLTCVVLKKYVGRAHNPHPHHFGSDRTRICPRLTRAIEVVGTLIVVPFWPLVIPYYVVKEVQNRMEERRVLKEDQKLEQLRVQREELERKSGSVDTQSANMCLSFVQPGERPAEVGVDGRGEEVVMVSEGPDGQPKMRVLREVV